MKFHDEKGKIGYIILWFLGVPASILILIFLLRGCTWFRWSFTGTFPQTVLVSSASLLDKTHPGACALPGARACRQIHLRLNTRLTTSPALTIFS